jgi:hypothetical protein
MPRGQVRGHHDSADSEAVGVVQDVYIRDSRDRPYGAILRVVFPHATAPHDSRTPLARHDAFPAQLLQFRNPAGVVEMNVRIDNNLHVFNSKT